MKFETFNEITERFVKNNLIPQTDKPVSRFVMGMALGSGALKAEAMIPQLDALGLVTRGEDGKPDGIDTQKLSAALTGGFAAVPTISFEKFGLKLTFKQGDADAYLAALGAA